MTWNPAAAGPDPFQPLMAFPLLAASELGSGDTQHARDYATPVFDLSDGEDNGDNAGDESSESDSLAQQRVETAGLQQLDRTPWSRTRRASPERATSTTA